MREPVAVRSRRPIGAGSPRPASRLLRRDVLTLGIGALVVAAAPFAAARRERVVRRRIPVMGTLAEVAVVARGPGDEARAHAAIDAAFDVLRRVDASMSAHSDTSDVGRLNRAAGSEAVAVGAATAHVVAEALRWASATDGAFDPCLGAASRVWDVVRRRAPPPDAAFRRYAGRSFWRTTDVGSWRGAPAVRLADPDAALDLGGIAKGYAVDRAADALRAREFTDALVNVGGDLVALGRSPSGEPWRVGVQSPDDPDGVIATIDASDIAIATSGDYVRCFRWRGRRYHHLLDSATAEPRATSVRSLTVEAPTCLDADAAATALYGTPTSEAMRILASRSPGARVVHSA